MYTFTYINIDKKSNLTCMLQKERTDFRTYPHFYVDTSSKQTCFGLSCLTQVLYVKSRTLRVCDIFVRLQTPDQLNVSNQQQTNNGPKTILNSYGVPADWIWLGWA